MRSPYSRRRGTWTLNNTDGFRGNDHRRRNTTLGRQYAIGGTDTPAAPSNSCSVTGGQQRWHARHGAQQYVQSVDFNNNST